VQVWGFFRVWLVGPQYSCSRARVHKSYRRLTKQRCNIADALAMPVVTRKVADFKLTGVTVVNPWARSP